MPSLPVTKNEVIDTILDERGSIPVKKRDFFFFATAYRPAVGSIQPVVQLEMLVDISTRISRPECEAYQTKNACSFTRLHPAFSFMV